MHPTIANNPLKTILHFALLERVLPKLLVEPHPEFNPPSNSEIRNSRSYSPLYPYSANVGLPRKATWHDIETLHPDLPLIWAGAKTSIETGARPLIHIFKQRFSPVALLYAWNLELSHYLEDLTFTLASPTASASMVNPYLYTPTQRRVNQKLKILRELTAFDPENHKLEMVAGLPLSIIFDDILGIFEEEAWDYPSEEFWNGLANYPHEGVERVLLFFRNSDVYCERIAVHLRHASNSEFRNLILPS